MSDTITAPITISTTTITAPVGNEATITTSMTAHMVDATKHLPSQTGHTGKVLGTDGTSASWSVPTGGGGGVIDDTPADGVTDHSISSNWAYDHVAAADPHTGYLKEADIDDAPVDGETAAPISSNWAFDHNADVTTKHLPAQATHSGKYLTTDGSTASWGAVAAGGGESISSFLLMGA